LDGLAALPEATGLTHEKPAAAGFMLVDGGVTDCYPGVATLVAAAYF